MRQFLKSLFLLLLLAGCASEGGVTGTGISAIVAGHVTVMDGGPDGGVEVSVDGTSAVIDAAGNFELFGDFSGPVDVRFSDPGEQREIGIVSISVPPGSTNILEDVVIDRGAAQPVEVTVVRQGSVVGRIERIECAPPGAVTIRLGNESPFSLLLSEEIVIRDESGSALGCRQLRRDDRIEATGVQLSTGVSIAFSVQLTERAAEPVENFPVEFGGSANSVDCDTGRVVVLVLTEEDPFLAKVRPRSNTELICVDEHGPRRCECEDIKERDIVQVRGVASVATPDAVFATSVFVFPGPAIVDVPVRVLRLGCAVGKIETEAELENTSQVIIARFGDQTRFVCDQQPCRCEDLRPDDILQLVGSPVVASGRPFVDVGLVRRLGP